MQAVSNEKIELWESLRKEKIPRVTFKDMSQEEKSNPSNIETEQNLSLILNRKFITPLRSSFKYKETAQLLKQVLHSLTFISEIGSNHKIPTIRYHTKPIKLVTKSYK